MQIETEDGFISLTALAEYLAISIRTVHRIIAGGHLHSLKIGHRRLVRRSAVAIWLADHEQKSAVG